MTQRHSNQGHNPGAYQQQGGRHEQQGDWGAGPQQSQQQNSARQPGESGNDDTGGNRGPGGQGHGPSYGGQQSAWDVGAGQHGAQGSGQFGGQQGGFGGSASGQWGGGSDYDTGNYPGAPQTYPQGSPGSFEPSGPYGAMGGAGGSQGSVYGGGPPGRSRGPSQQRLEHQAWQRDQGPGLHGGVVPGSQGPYGDYGEMQGHHGGYWYGGREGTDPSFSQGRDQDNWRRDGWQRQGGAGTPTGFGGQHGHGQERHGGGYPGFQGQGEEHHDPDYHQWRNAQLRSFDDDYRQWRQERFNRFSDEFSQWRQNRLAQASSSNQQGTSVNASSAQGSSGALSPESSQDEHGGRIRSATSASSPSGSTGSAGLSSGGVGKSK